MKNLFIEREKKKKKCIYGQEKDNAEVSSCHLIGKQNENMVWDKKEGSSQAEMVTGKKTWNTVDWAEKMLQK